MGSQITREEIEHLIQQQGPILQMHPKEEYLPNSFEWYLRRPKLRLYDGHGNHQRIPSDLPTGEGSQKMFLGYPWDEKDLRKGGQDARAYIAAGSWDDRGRIDDGLALQYWVFSSFNGPASARFRVRLDASGGPFDFYEDVHVDVTLPPAGEHQADWEHLIVFYQRRGPGQFTAERVQAYAHGTPFEYWPPGTPDKPTWQERDGRPLFFSSLNGHATFPATGRYKTPGGSWDKHIGFDPGILGVHLGSASVAVALELSNFCADGGRVLDMSKEFELLESKVPGVGFKDIQWRHFQGRCGMVDPNVGDVSDDLKSAIKHAIKEGLEKMHIPSWLPIGPVLDAAGDLTAPLVSKVIGKFENYDGPRMPGALR